MIGLVVDGMGDKAALSARFRTGFKILRTDGPRGATVSLDHILSGSIKQIRILRALGCQSIVVVVDFEERLGSHDDFIRKLSRFAAEVGHCEDVVVASPNRMIENWYLADVEEISKRRKYIRSNVRQRPFEGRHGKKELKKVFANGFYYNEVRHGPELFTAIRLDIARQNSRSLDHFLTLVGIN